MTLTFEMFSRICEREGIQRKVSSRLWPYIDFKSSNDPDILEILEVSLKRCLNNPVIREAIHKMELER